MGDNDKSMAKIFLLNAVTPREEECYSKLGIYEKPHHKRLIKKRLVDPFADRKGSEDLLRLRML